MSRPAGGGRWRRIVLNFPAAGAVPVLARVRVHHSW